MLIQLDSKVISKYWGDIKETLRYNLLPIANASDESMNVVLEAMIRGDLQVWSLMGESDIVAIIVTQRAIEPATNTSNLLIYSLYGYSFISEELWLDSMATLRRFAKGKNCSKIIAYSKVPRVLEIAEQLGADTSIHLITLEI